MKYTVRLIAILCTIWFIYRITVALQTYTLQSYGNPARQAGYIIGLLLSSYIIPFILWIIYFATKSKSEPYKAISSRQALEARTQILDEQQIKIENNIVQLIKNLKLLKNAYEQRLVNKEKFQFESNKIKEEVADLTEEKENTEDRIEAINNLEDEFSNLEKLLEQKFIESSEYESKVEKLIENYIENYL
jgi:hypothetical protein